MKNSRTQSSDKELTPWSAVFHKQSGILLVLCICVAAISYLMLLFQTTVFSFKIRNNPQILCIPRWFVDAIACLTLNYMVWIPTFLFFLTWKGLLTAKNRLKIDKFHFLLELIFLSFGYLMSMTISGAAFNLTGMIIGKDAYQPEYEVMNWDGQHLAHPINFWVSPTDHQQHSWNFDASEVCTDSSPLSKMNFVNAFISYKDNLGPAHIDSIISNHSILARYSETVFWGFLIFIYVFVVYRRFIA